MVTYAVAWRLCQFITIDIVVFNILAYSVAWFSALPYQFTRQSYALFLKV